MPTWTKWHVSALLTVWFSVGVTIMLMSISAGVEQDVNNRLSVVQDAGNSPIDIGTINDILHALTLVIVVALGIQAAFTTGVIATAVMVTRQQELGQDRRSGFAKHHLAREAALDLAIPIFGGAAAGWAAGVVASGILAARLPLSTHYLYLFHFIVVGATVVATMLVIYSTAYHFSGKSPKASGAS